MQEKSSSSPKHFKPGTALALRFALRELRGGIKGFYIFLACIALGVTAIVSVNSISLSITRGIAQKGQVILGGDIAFSVLQQDLKKEPLEFLGTFGTISKTVMTSTMARSPDNSNQAVIELKAVDAAYPHYGKFTGSNGTVDTKDLQSDKAYVDKSLLEQMNMGVGSIISIGNASFIVEQTIENEPDRVSDGFSLGARVIISLEGIKKTGLIRPGSLIRYNYKIKNPRLSDHRLKEIIQNAEIRFPETGWHARSRTDPAPRLSRNIDRFSQFLTLIGLTSLITGGVGVACAVRTFLEKKRLVIASFKALGASGNLIFQIYFIQIMTLACSGIIIGLALATLISSLATQLLVDVIPVTRGAVFSGPLALGVFFGLLTAMAFSIRPLAISGEIPAAELLRSKSFTLPVSPHPVYTALLLLNILALAGLAIWNAENQYMAILFTAAIAFCFILLQTVSRIIQHTARLIPKVGPVEWRMAVANIYRPGSPTSSIVMSLGLGLTLLVSLMQVDTNIRKQLNESIPESAPSFFFMDIQDDEVDDFRKRLSTLVPDSRIIAVPMLRGRIVTLKGIKVRDYDANGAEWVLNGDRSMTYASNIPENSTLKKGKWWSGNYSGEPLVSVSAKEAEALGLEIGDSLSVNVSGRIIKAKIANFRNVNWESLNINFVLVFSPDTFANAPHSYLATLLINNRNTAPNDGKIVQEVTKSYPTVTSIRIRDAIDSVNEIMDQLSIAIRAAMAITMIASILVLASSLTTGNQLRMHDSVILKTLGATRWCLIRIFAYEYALLGASITFFSLIAGSISSWFIISEIMGFSFHFFPSIAIFTLIMALIGVTGSGLTGSWRILGKKVAPILKEP